VITVLPELDAAMTDSSQTFAASGSGANLGGGAVVASRPRRQGLILGFGLLVSLMIVATAILVGLTLRESERQSWRKQLGNLSFTLAEQASQTMFSAHTVLDSLYDVVRAANLDTPERWQAFVSDEARHQLLVDKVRSNPVIDVATFTSSTGQVLNFTRSFPPPPINLAERDYFKAHASEASIHRFTSVPVRNKGNGKWVFYITQRVNNSKGEMLGLILVGVSVEVFSKFYEHVASNLGEGASIALFRKDLTLMTRYPLKDDLVGKQNLEGASSEFVKRGGRGTEIIETSAPRFSGGGQSVPRMAAPTVLDRYPLVVTPVVTEEFYLRGWRKTRNWIAGVAVFCLVLLSLGIVMLLRAARAVEEELAERVRAQAMLSALHEQLEHRVQERTAELSKEVRERTQAQAELADLNARIASVSHRAGMAEVANSVLHNVGNVLNSVNVSVTVLGDRLRATPLTDLPAASALIDAHVKDLPHFLTQDPQGQQFPAFLRLLAGHWRSEQDMLLSEAEKLRSRVQQIKEIVSRQQALSGQTGLREWIDLKALVNEVLIIHAGPLTQSKVEVEISHGLAHPWMGDRIKIGQIVLNLVVNAEESLSESRVARRRLAISVTQEDTGGLVLSVSDNGLGIDPLHMPRLFTYGFTTKPAGHGFGLHASALSAHEMGGQLEAFSDGMGQGARFVLRLPEEMKWGQ
jgi:signal transduction histidine kinase